MANRRQISLDELAKHNKENDAWIAIKGQVFDITSFIPKHPGGEAPLLKYIGKDGTKPFDMVHSYVDFKSMLKGNEKGVLEGAGVVKKQTTNEDITAPSTASILVLGDTEEQNTFCCGIFKKKDIRYPNAAFYDSPGAVILEVKFNSDPKREGVVQDWSVGIMRGKILMITKYVDNSRVWMGSYRLYNEVGDTTMSVKIKNNEYNICEVVIQKQVQNVDWANIGTAEPQHNMILNSADVGDTFGGWIVYKEPLTPDVNLYGIRLQKSVQLGIPVGHHVLIRIDRTFKPYTPNCFSLVGKNTPGENEDSGNACQTIYFIIKTYPEGALTSLLSKIPVSKPDSLSPEPPLKISHPQGSFNFRDLHAYSKTSPSVVVMFAGGTGLTPMTKIIEWLKGKVENGGGNHRVLFISYNKTEDDIIWRNELEELAKTSPSFFSFVPILTRPSEEWTGIKGRPERGQIKNIMDKQLKGAKAEMEALICGSVGFIEAVEKEIVSLFPKKNIYPFMG